MNKLFSSIFILLSISSVAGCLPRALAPNAEKIEVLPSSNYDAMLKNCKFLGQISGKNIHGESTYFASSDKLEADDINFLKNEAAKLGANVVLFAQHQAISTPHTSASRKAYYTETIHTIQGSAYLCPSDTKWKLNRWQLETHYTY